MFLFKVTDVETGEVRTVVAKDVVEAASIITTKYGPRLRAYDRLRPVRQQARLSVGGQGVAL